MNSNTPIIDFINIIEKNEYKCSQTWKKNIDICKSYIIENYNNLDNYRIDNVCPHIFTWPEDGIQNKYQLNILENDKDSIYYKNIFKNNYGPKKIILYKNVQLDRVQHIFSLYFIEKKLNFDINNNNELIFEFGAGTGQLADVLNDLNFKGTHIIYDLPIITLLQKYFIEKQGIKVNYILDNNEDFSLNKTNILPCNQNISEKKIMMLPNITFIASYSLTETDADTRNKFLDYIINFKRVYIIYWPYKDTVGDNIDNNIYINELYNKMKLNYNCNIIDWFNNGKLFTAIKL